MNKQAKFLGVGALALLCISATGSLRNLPSMAVYGWESVFWFAAATLLFLLPISLVAAELGTSVPAAGGLFGWIRAAFDEKTGSLGVWCEWAGNVVWFPTILSFVAGSLAYAINPDLVNNSTYMVIIMLSVLWGLTLLNFLGTKFSAQISSFGTVAGTIVPQTLLLILAGAYVLAGNPIHIPFSPEALVPDFTITSLPLLAVMITMFAGMEIAGYHSAEVRNPAKSYPKALIMACVAIATLLLLGTLAISIVVPLENLNLVAGLMQAFSDFLTSFNLQSLIPFVAILVAVGAVATISTWLFGPAKGVRAAAERGSYPPVFRGANKHDAPTHAMVISSIGGSVFILLFLLIPSVNAAYWMLSALTSQMLTIMYCLIFLAAMKLRYSQPELERPYKIPGGKFGLWLVCGAGLLACMFALVVGFIPPASMPGDARWIYVLAMITGFVTLLCPPFLFSLFKKKSWVKA